VASTQQTQPVAPAPEELENAVVTDSASLAVKRLFTIPGRDPFEEIEWERRDALIPGKDKPVFEQKDVEFPKFWSQTATNIVAQKYFRGRMSSPERETSVKQMVGRVVSTIGSWGRQGGYFATEAEAETFEAELKAILVNQYAAFNSPVWFNLGFEERPQASACFILSIDDSMESILDWIRREGVIFRGGSGSGVNLSKLRSSKEQLSKGGYASGPVSFMRGADASAGTIKSGGKTRRAAKMVVLDIDHPDIEEFIWCKAKEERKARVLEAAGYDMTLDSGDWASIQYQNANNSVRVTDGFMEAAAEGREWNLTARTDGTVLETKDARDLLQQIAAAAWESADPGVQYDTTINNWHTLPNTSRINASNPCCFVAETLVDTEEGLVRFDELLERRVRGESLPRVWAFAVARDEPELRQITNVWIAGLTTRLVEVTTQAGHALQCTPDHRFLTTHGYVEAARLQGGTELVASGSAVDHDSSDSGIATLRRTAVRDVVAAVRPIELSEPVPVFDLEAVGDHNLSVGSQPGETVVVHNSEYMSIDDSACNLASLNLLKFRREDGEFDVDAFEHAVDVVFLAQEILVGYSSYPTPEIERNAKAYRQLGLGYANLGALLMARGLPYDSDEGRAYAAAITALMTGRAYRKSAEIAARMGAFAGYQPNAAAMIGVMAQHRASVGNIESDKVPADLLRAARQSWDETLDLGEVSGYRNAQATVLAPTGTISFMMDCDTTGVEPDFSLVKSKKLVGGGEITIVNKTVPMALEKLGYAPREVEEIVAFVDERNTVIGAPYVKKEHYPVFDCAVGERAINYMGHVKMMGATQPFISGAISKTVNMPETVTVEDVAKLYEDAWRLGVKAIAIYRDNCKVAQPLSKKTDEKATTLVPTVAPVAAPRRHRLPEDRTEVGRKFRVGDYEGYIHVGLFDDGTPGDIFVDIAKEGTTLAGLMNSFMISVSLGLQYGVPLEVYVSKFSHMRFEPHGPTNDPDIRVAKSIVDYVFRWMGKKFLSADQQEELGILSPEVRSRLARQYNGESAPAASEPTVSDPAPPGQTALFNAWEDAVECAKCGGRMIRTGSCYTCRDCGSNTGCS
jgi:ribonucleotide reductase alpha subunit